MRFLKRFPTSKHQQILQVISYLEMCGLSGSDIVSIGGYLSRVKNADERKKNLARVRAIKIKPVTSKRRFVSLDYVLDEAFSIETINGTYRFDRVAGIWSIRSNKTKVIKNIKPTDTRQWSRHFTWARRDRYNIMLDIADGILKLDF